MLQKRAWKSDLIRSTCESDFKHNQSQTQQTELQIREEFEKLHQFFREEEEARITALREEEEKKEKRMKERCDKVEELIEFISDTIRAIEEEMNADDTDFQKNYGDTIRRVWKCQKKPRKVFRTLIDVPKHVGNLRFKVWEKMLETVPCFPVTLDPNSTFTLQADLNQSFSWVVDVGQSSNWTLGVAKTTAKQEEIYKTCPEEGLWTISLQDGEYHAMTSPPERLEINSHRPERIRVCVDWKGGRLSFTDPDNDIHLYTFSHTFTEPLLPYFESFCPGHPLPQRVSVVVQKHKLSEDDNGDDEEEARQQEGH
ncbi:nuclear factor 7, brain-like isoform X2 [Salminus brasiliensis]